MAPSSFAVYASYLRMTSPSRRPRGERRGGTSVRRAPREGIETGTTGERQSGGACEDDHSLAVVAQKPLQSRDRKGADAQTFMTLCLVTRTESASFSGTRPSLLRAGGAWPWREAPSTAPVALPSS